MTGGIWHAARVPTRSSALDRAEHALAQVDDDPVAALKIAEDVLAMSAEPEAITVALRGIGRARARQGDPREARRVLRRSIKVAESGRLPVRAAQARASLVVVLVTLGEFESGLAEAAKAESVLTGADLGHLLAQRAVALSRLDRTEEALAAYNRALRLTPRSDPRTTALMLLNRGLLLTYRGAFVAARRDLDRAAGLCKQHRLRTVESFVIHNLGYLTLLEGDLVSALAEFDRSEQMRRELAVDAFEVVLDRAEALLTANLSTEAVTTARTAVELAATSGRRADLAEAELTLARALLVAGNPDVARPHAVRARTLFRRQGRSGWAAIADELALRARWEAGERNPQLIKDAVACAEGLEDAGWRAPALRARVLAAEALIAAHRPAEAAVELRNAGTARRRGDADLRVAAWHAEALLRVANGDRPGALRALTAGLDVVSAHSAALGATDLRTQSMTRGRRLADLGLNLVMERDRPRDVLRWLERVRTTALRRRPVRPPLDAHLAADLADLRRITSAITQVRAAGNDTSELRRQQLRLERTIRDHARQARGRGEESDHLDITALGSALGDRALIEYFWLSDRLFAVVLVSGRCTVAPLGSYDDALREAESLRFALHRLARRHGTTDSLAVANATRAYAAAALDAALLAPLQRVVGDREIVVVPTMRLHALPWPALPSLAGRPVSVAPSAALWLAAVRAPRRRSGTTVIAAGPDLVFAEPELHAVSRLHPGASLLRGSDATAQRVLEAMDGARVAHVACHGHFRSDNPQFSSLRLADGPLMVYDLERLKRAPDLIVLSSCDAGLSTVHPGDELMGLSSALFALGTRTLVAAVNPVDDEAAMTLMIDFHARLTAGRSPAAALAEAQQEHGVIGFACFGAG